MKLGPVAIFTIVVAMLILIVGFPAITAHPVPDVSWGIIVPATVPYGQSIPVFITGPGGASYHVNVSAEPYATSYPVISFNGSLMNTTVVSGLSSANLSVPSTNLTFGPYRVQLYSLPAWTPIAGPTVRIVDPLNDTALANQVAFLQYNQTIEDERQNSLYVQQSAFAGQIEGIYLTSIAETILFVFALIITRTSAAENEYVLRFKRGLSYVFMGSWFREFGSWVADGFTVPRPIPDKYFRSWYCRKCRIIDRTQAEMETHLITAHRVHKPILNVNYVAHAPTNKRIQRILNGPKMRMDPLKEVAAKRVQIDITTDTKAGGK